MPTWVLSCPSCLIRFAHAKIADVTLADHLFPLKPKIAVGQMIECPNCGKSATYKTINLTYRA
jgi:hypothetical protein